MLSVSNVSLFSPEITLFVCVATKYQDSYSLLRRLIAALAALTNQSGPSMRGHNWKVELHGAPTFINHRNELVRKRLVPLQRKTGLLQGCSRSSSSHKLAGWKFSRWPLFDTHIVEGVEESVAWLRTAVRLGSPPAPLPSASWNSTLEWFINVNSN